MKERKRVDNLNLKLMMEKRGYDALALEYRCGVSASKIMKYLRGEKDINRAWAYTVYRIAEALKCKTGDILNHNFGIDE